MGVNLVPSVRNFEVSQEAFLATSEEVQDGCITAGNHRLLRFDSLTHNVGAADLALGNPADHPEWFELDPVHGHYHLKEFTTFALYDVEGNLVASSKKLGREVVDVEHLSPHGPQFQQFTTNSNQGISAGWADRYHASIKCQYMIIDGVAAGEYTLVATANASRLFSEDTYADNTRCFGVSLAGDCAAAVPPPIHVTPDSLAIAFGSVLAGTTALQDICFEICSCRSPITLQIVGGPFAHHAPGTPAEPPPPPAPQVFSLPSGVFAIALLAADSPVPRQACFTIAYAATAPGDLAYGSLHVRCLESGQDFYLAITGDTI